MSLHWKNAETMATQANLLGELFDWIQGMPGAHNPNRDRFLREIGESIGFDEEYIQKSIEGKGE